VVWVGCPNRSRGPWYCKPGAGLFLKAQRVVGRIGMLAYGAKICGGAGKLVWMRGEMQVVFSIWARTSR
jgi:hypothetical protein